MRWITVATGLLFFSTGLSAASTVIVRNGRSDYRIVTPAAGSPATEYAAKELQAFVQQMTGARPPVLSENTTDDGPAFLLGPCEWSASGAPGGDAQGRVLEMDARFAPVPKGMVFDLMRIDRARTENCADWRTASVWRAGRLLRTVFQHPNGRNDGDATYEAPLPATQPGVRLLLKFATVISNRTQDGVRFSILINGNEMWSETKTAFIAPDLPDTRPAHDGILPGHDPFSDHVLDVSKYAGQTIRLTLRVNALANNANDWANWVEPRIVEGP